jgi:hypothetical protein
MRGAARGGATSGSSLLGGKRTSVADGYFAYPHGGRSTEAARSATSSMFCPGGAHVVRSFEPLRLPPRRVNAVPQAPASGAPAAAPIAARVSTTPRASLGVFDRLYRVDPARDRASCGSGHPSSSSVRALARRESGEWFSILRSCPVRRKGAKGGRRSRRACAAGVRGHRRA